MKWRKAELAHAEAEAAANPGSRNHARNVQSKKKRLDNSQARLDKARAANKPTPKAKAQDTPDYRQRAEAKARKEQELATRPLRREQVLKENNSAREEVRAQTTNEDPTASDLDKAIAAQDSRNARVKRAQALADFWDGETDSAEVKREREAAHADLDREKETQRNADIAADAHKTNTKLEDAAQKARRKREAKKGDNVDELLAEAKAEQTYRKAISDHLRKAKAGKFAQAKADADLESAEATLKRQQTEHDRYYNIRRGKPNAAQYKTRDRAANILETDQFNRPQWAPGRLANLTDKDLDDAQAAANYDARTSDRYVSGPALDLAHAIDEERNYRAKRHDDPRVTYGADGQATIHADDINDALDQIGNLDDLLPPNEGTTIRRPGHITAKIGNKSVFITPDLETVGQKDKRVWVSPVGDRTSPGYAKGTNVPETDLKKGLTAELGNYKPGRDKQQHMVDVVQQAQHTLTAAGGADNLTTDQVENMTRQFRQSAADFPDNTAVIQEQANNLRRAKGLPEVNFSQEQDAPSLDGTEGLRNPQANSNDYMSMKPADRDAALYDLVQNADGNTTRDFMDATGMSRSSTLAALKRLEARGLLNRESQSGGTREGISGGRGAVNEDLAWRPAHVIDEDDQAAEVDRLLADHKAGKKIDTTPDTPDTTPEQTPAQEADEWATTVVPEALASRAQSMTDLNKSLNAGGHHRERALQIITNEPDAYGKDEAEFNERRKAVTRRLNAEKKAAQQRNADAHAAALTGGIPADATRADLMELRATNRKAMKDTNSATAEHGRLERLARRIDDQIKALDKADAAERKAQQAAEKELDLKGVKARGIRNGGDITTKR